MIVSPRVGPAPTSWLALGPRATAALQGRLPAGSRLRSAASIHEALARLVRRPVEACLVDAGALGDRPRAALRALCRQAGEASLYVLRTPGAEREVRAAEAVGVPVRDGVDDLVEAAPAPEPSPEAERPRAGRRPRGRSFAEGVLARIEDPAALGAFVLEAFLHATGAGRGSLLLREPGRDTLCLRAAIGLAEGLVDQARCAPGAGIAGRAASLARPLLGEGARGGPRGYEGTAYVVLPLVAGRAAEGVVCLSDLPGDRCPAERGVRRLVRMARQAGRGLRAARRLHRAESLSSRDRLTSLPNRRAFDRALSREMERTRRTGAALALAILDLDRFKTVNDSHGHPAGDRVLAEAARRLKAGLRETDLVARHGGEEFGVLLTGLPPEAVPEALRILERLRVAVRTAPFSPGAGKEPVRMTISVGFTVFSPRSGDLRDATGLLQAADAALYRAKDLGRDNVQGG